MTLSQFELSIHIYRGAPRLFRVRITEHLVARNLKIKLHMPVVVDQQLVVEHFLIKFEHFSDVFGDTLNQLETVRISGVDADFAV